MVAAAAPHVQILHSCAIFWVFHAVFFKCLFCVQFLAFLLIFAQFRAFMHIFCVLIFQASASAILWVLPLCDNPIVMAEAENKSIKKFVKQNFVSVR